MKPSLILLLLGAMLSTPLMADSGTTDESRFLSGYNRIMFKFNDGLDTVVLKPLAKGYRAVTPEPVETGIYNIFSNLGEITNIFNDVLQGKIGQALNDSGRFVVNTTVGIVGLFDAASKMGLEKSDGEDFGQTLGSWGVNSGSYLVLPLLGPSNLRDAPSRIIDAFTNPIGYVEHVPTRNTIIGTNIISDRASLIDAESLISGDKYQLIKDAYLQRREFLVKDGLVEDDFGSYEDY